MGGARADPPPRVLVAVAVAVITVAVVLAVLGATRTGVTTDEPIHVMRLRNLFGTGWYALDWDYDGAGPGGEGTNTFVYAPVTMLLLHAWCVLWGVEGWGEVSGSAHAYDLRHLGVVLLGMLCLAAVAATGRVLLGHWRWGLVAAAALASVPMWTGHTMFNVKDVPVATGHTVLTLGLLLSVGSRSPGALLRLARAGCVVAGLVLTLGTRPGMWPGVLVVLALAAGGLLLTGATRRAVLLAEVELVVACTVAALALVAVYPRLFGHPLRALPRTSEASSSFLGGAKSDRWYVPRHLALEMPTLLLVFAVTGAVAAAGVVWAARRHDRVPAVRVALVGAQALALPVAAVVMGSDLYHGLRQLLFAIPALAVLTACGMAWWTGRPRVRLRGPAAVVAAAALVLPTVDQVTLQPYQTTYVNLAADLLAGPGSSPDARPGGDYWRVSLPELLEAAPLDRQLLCKATTDPASGRALPFANAGEAFSTSRSLDCREEVNGPLAPDGLPVTRALPVTEFDAVFLGPLPGDCTRLGDVRRRRHGLEVVVSTLGRCAVEVPLLTSTGARVDDPVFGTGAAGDLWRHALDGWQQWPGDAELTATTPVAELLLRPASPCARSGCVLVVTGEGPPDLVATVEGREVPVARGASGALELPVPPGTDPVWVTLTRRSGGVLGLRMSALSLAAPGSTPATEGRP
ncbi:hypothetical protein [Nocardioides sp. 503]|uniref:hypothetical protein n=1 Tax=Nocardioides sp. 503 TaxID=2508326 RepID=UPI00143082BE|nr:hypothetical protein [Nocardioides sp. 503]